MSTELEGLEQRLINSPAARARFLADTIGLFEKNGVNIDDADFQQQMQPALDLTDGQRFLSGLAASSVVIVAATAGQRSAVNTKESLSQTASSVVIVAATAGQRSAMGAAQGGLNKAASSVVIVAASAGQRSAMGAAQSGLNKAASSVVIVAASAGQRSAMGAAQSSLSQAASSVVIVAASAGQRGAMSEATQGGFESLNTDVADATVTISIPSAITLAEIAHGLQAIAEILLSESVALDQQVKSVVE